MGLHASRQLTRRVADQIKRALGSTAIVSMRQSGTIVALLSEDRVAAEQTAREVVQRVETTPFSLNGHGATTQVSLACGIVAFPQAGPSEARRVPAAMLEASAVASNAS